MAEPRRSLRAIFDEASEIPPGDQRRAYLDGACGADAALRAEVEELLRAQDTAGGFLADPKRAAPLAPGGSMEREGDGIGRYKLLQKIGEGGCGIVYMAEQTEPVKRRVALKIIKLGMDTRSVVARFEAERQALALMDHPCVARVLDAGATETGRPYFVMELVRGIKITEYCDQNHLSTRERLHLFIQVCQAVQHAHQKAIIHRDLKPSNVLVTSNDGMPLPKVIDFGIAKATAGIQLTDKTLFTRFEMLIGTPAYMSPEQAEFSASDIDTRTDIYALGVLLYELLTGQTPFDASELLSQGIDALRRTIREQEPPKPSTRLTKELAADRARQKSTQGLGVPTQEEVEAAHRRRKRLREQIALLRGDLDWIVLKAIEKDRTRRYETANGLAMDIKRYLANEPVIARPPSAAYRVKKMWQRNKLAFTAGALVVLTSLAGLSAVIFVQQRANQEYRQRFYAYQMGRAGAALAAGQFDHLETALAQCPVEQRHWEWNYLNTQVHRWNLRPLFNLEQPLRKLLLSRDGSVAAVLTGGQVGPIQILRIPSGAKLAHIEMRTSMWRRALALSPDGNLLAGSPGDTGQLLQVWDTHTGKLLQQFEQESDIKCVAFSIDGRRLAAGGGNAQVDFWNVDTWKPRQPALDIHQALALAFAPDQRTIAVGIRAGEIHLVDLASGRPVLRLRAGEGEVDMLAFSPDGKKLLSTQFLPARGRTLLRLWNLADGSSKELGLSYGWNAQFSPDGRWIMNGGRSFWDAESGELLGQLRLEDQSQGMATLFHPNGGVLSAGPGNQVIMATLDRPASQRLLGHQAGLRIVKFSPDGQTVASAGLESSIRLWSVTGVHEMKPYGGHSQGVPAVAWSPDGRTAVSSSFDQSLQCWDPVTLKSRWTVSMSDIGSREAWWLEFSPNGKQILSSSETRVLGLWDALTGASLGHMAVTNGFGVMDGAAWSSDGTRIAGLFKKRLVLWRVAGWQQEWSVPVAANRCVRFSADGRWLAYANLDGSIGLRDASSGGLIRSLDRHQAFATSVALSADGRRVFSGGGDGTVRVWDSRSGDELLQLHVTGDRYVWSIDLSPDGRTLAAADSDGVVTLWKTQ
jgi:WD40 repeat protein/serine/threonine protein kinase